MIQKRDTRTALVTGGCGFVGRHLTKRLIEENYTVWIVDNLSTGQLPQRWLTQQMRAQQYAPATTRYSDGKREVIFIQDNVINFFSNQLQLGKANKATELPVFDDIYHLASVVGGRSIIEEDPIAVAIDLAIDAIFFQWLVKNKARINRILYTSSSAAYPTSLQTDKKSLALKEEHINFEDNLGMPDMTYGWSKLTGEYLSQISARQYGIHIACVRPFSGYGGDQDQTYPIPAIARRAARKENPLIVWGTGEQGRDFIHIDDCIEAMLLATNAISDGSGVNIGTGTLTTFKEVARIFAELAGYSPQIKPLVNKPTGVQSRYGDVTNMKKILNWEPQISLRDGFAQVLAEQKQALTNKKTRVHQPAQSQQS